MKKIITLTIITIFAICSLAIAGPVEEAGLKILLLKERQGRLTAESRVCAYQLKEAQAEYKQAKADAKAAAEAEKKEAEKLEKESVK